MLSILPLLCIVFLDIIAYILCSIQYVYVFHWRERKKKLGFKEEEEKEKKNR
jgi:hypothetical protein